ncbi:MAG: YncE family protein [Bacteroidia bacterium]|nr:YncE family protein [Bacteroidia bacterium]
MGKNLNYFFIAILLSGFFSCKKDVPPQKAEQVVSTGSSGKVYVLCEGNFLAANASVTQVTLASGNIISDIYSTANNSNPLGDVLQSMSLHNNKYYIVLNNSNKIEIVDKYNFTQQGNISGLTSPRYFLPLSSNKAYVSDLYANAISIVDLNSNTTAGSIPLNGWTEEMVFSYGKVFVANKKTNYVYVIDAATDALSDSINVGYGSSSIAEDKNGKLWVLCSGSSSLGLNAKLARINPLTKTVDTSFTFTSGTKSPFKMKMNGNKDQLYWIDYDGVYTMNISSAGLPSAFHIAQGNKIFYGLGIDPEDGTIYVADAIDYNQNGKIYRYQNNGTPIDNFSSGIIPGDFYFEK